MLSAVAQKKKIRKISKNRKEIKVWLTSSIYNSQKVKLPKYLSTDE